MAARDSTRAALIRHRLLAASGKISLTELEALLDHVERVPSCRRAYAAMAEVLQTPDLLYSIFNFLEIDEAARVSPTCSLWAERWTAKLVADKAPMPDPALAADVTRIMKRILLHGNSCIWRYRLVGNGQRLVPYTHHSSTNERGAASGHGQGASRAGV
jgi:hypothetical protein